MTLLLSRIIIKRAYELIAQAPSAIIAATREDSLELKTAQSSGCTG